MFVCSAFVFVLEFLGSWNLELISSSGFWNKCRWFALWGGLADGLCKSLRLYTTLVTIDRRHSCSYSDMASSEFDSAGKCKGSMEGSATLFPVLYTITSGFVHDYTLALWPSALGRHFAPGEGANIHRRLVPYHGKSMQIQSHIEFIYIYIYMHQRPPHARHRKIWPW